ncbi:6712_t:CDS:2 [Cetraspora pellucida]|uniref:6712_t:CDS:1 n=1 Tax=Cetraspora pellucida TaxID=1433469 RepID=A0ACA9N009_9GLOM|nr:6712_t:CDS:2 [Cetraspora pellucida]
MVKDMLGYLFLILLFLLLVTFHYRKTILAKLPYLNQRYQRLPAVFSTNSFQSDIEGGLTSESFNLHQNLVDGDNRSGLEDSEEIKRIMETEGLNFDQARLLRMQRKFKTNNIDPQTGVPRDPKLVTFSN